MKVEFLFNKALDKEMILFFLKNHTNSGVDFTERVLKVHSTLNKYDKNSKDFEFNIYKYVDDFYKENKTVILKGQKFLEEEWRLVEKDYFAKLKELFKVCTIKQNPICFISIIDCHPRFLDDYSFQLFFGNSSSINIVSHEILHFFFYDYTKLKMFNIFRDLDRNSGIYWDLAEIFNNIILSSEQFITTLGIKEDTPYSEHRRFLTRAREIYKESPDIDKFIINLFEYLKSQK